MSSLIFKFRHNFQNFRRYKLKKGSMSKYVVNLFIIPDYHQYHKYNLAYYYRIFYILNLVFCCRNENLKSNQQNSIAELIE